jgi:hypothetical protein
MGEPGRIQAFLGWWRELPTGWRVNVGLYVLAGVSLIALLTQIVVGRGSRPGRVEVAARAPNRPTTTVAAPSTTEATSTTVEPLVTAPPAPAEEPPPAPTSGRTGGGARGARGGGGGGGGGGGSPSPATFGPAPTSLICRQSVDPACGRFRWEPPPGENRGLTIDVSSSPEAPRVGDTVTFTVRVTDPDHIVTGNCTEVDLGVNGTFVPHGCVPPPCPAAHGPWSPPAQHTGSQTFTFTETYPEARTYTARFTFRTDRDGCPDPYGSSDTATVNVSIAPPAQGQGT